MLELSTTTRGIVDWKMKERRGKKMNFTRINASMREAIQLQMESSFHKKYQIFPKTVLGFFWGRGSFFLKNFIFDEDYFGL